MAHLWCMACIIPQTVKFFQWFWLCLLRVEKHQFPCQNSKYTGTFDLWQCNRMNISSALPTGSHHTVITYKVLLFIIVDIFTFWGILTTGIVSRKICYNHSGQILSRNDATVLVWCWRWVRWWQWFDNEIDEDIKPSVMASSLSCRSAVLACVLLASVRAYVMMLSAYESDAAERSWDSRYRTALVRTARKLDEDIWKPVYAPSSYKEKKSLVVSLIKTIAQHLLCSCKFVG